MSDRRLTPDLYTIAELQAMESERMRWMALLVMGRTVTAYDDSDVIKNEYGSMAMIWEHAAPEPTPVWVRDDELIGRAISWLMARENIDNLWFEKDAGTISVSVNTVLQTLEDVTLGVASIATGPDELTAILRLVLIVNAASRDRAGEKHSAEEAHEG